MVWGCYLATTFDVLSDPTAFSPAPTNDSILFKLKLEAEATCTTSPTKRASTFYLVEGEMFATSGNEIKVLMKP
jgi:hypothetical protein